LESRALQRDQMSINSLVEDYTLEEARAAIDRLVWTFGEASPPEEGLTEQGSHLLAIGMDRPEVIPDLVALLQTRPRLRGQLTLVLAIIGRVGHGRRVGGLLLPLLRDRDPHIVAAAAWVAARLDPPGEVAEALCRELLGLFTRNPEWDADVRAALAIL